MGSVGVGEFHVVFVSKFDGCNNSYEHVASINTEIEIIGTYDSLKWYLGMGLPWLLVKTYQNLVKKLVHQFAANRHENMVATILFNIHQGPFESMREYLANFNEATIKFVHPNKGLFI